MPAGAVRGLRHLLRASEARLLPDGLRAPFARQGRQARALLWALLFALPVETAYLLAAIVRGREGMLPGLVLLLAGTLASLVLLRLRGAVTAAACLHLLCVLGVLAHGLVELTAQTPMLVGWLALLPACAIALGGRRFGLVWLGLCAAVAVVLGRFIDTGLIGPTGSIHPARLESTLAWTSALLFCLGLTLAYDRLTQRGLAAIAEKNAEIEAAHARIAADSARLAEEVGARRRMEDERSSLRSGLVEVSRVAGIADDASDVLLEVAAVLEKMAEGIEEIDRCAGRQPLEELAERVEELTELAAQPVDQRELGEGDEAGAEVARALLALVQRVEEVHAVATSEIVLLQQRADAAGALIAERIDELTGAAREGDIGRLADAVSLGAVREGAG